MGMSDSVNEIFVVQPKHPKGLDVQGFTDWAELAEYAMVRHATRGHPNDWHYRRLEVIERLQTRDREAT